MENVSSIRDLVNLWPTRAALAAEINAEFPFLGVTTGQVHKWAEKDSIPARYQFAVLCVGQNRGFDISSDLILRLHMVSRSAA